MKKVLLISVMCLALTGCLEKNAVIQDSTADEIQPTVTAQPAENEYVDIGSLGNLFGFTNNTGKLIIPSGQMDETKEMAGINKAIGEGGNILDIKHLGAQKGNEKDNGRLTSQNFDNLAGQLFEITHGTAKENETYYLVNDGEFNIKSILDSKEGNRTEIDKTAKEEIERIKKRKVQNSWQIGRLEADRTIYLVLFEREDDDMLASIVMKTPGKFVFKDYPAKYDVSSTWRVDDSGTVSPDMFSILFAAEAENGMVLGIKWMGAEGEVTMLLKENGEIFEELNIGASRYMSPF